MSDSDFYFGSNQVPVLDCERTRWYGYLRAIAKQNLQELAAEKIEQEMDFIIEQQEMKKRNYSFRTWLFNHKINSADHNIKDFKATTDSSCFRYISKSGLYIDSDLLPMLHADGWINKDISELTFNDFIKLYEVNPVHDNYL